ncbi:hypothetical protein AN618_16070 [Fervidicola ferrireducens]|uniref:Uncharacterized protein n=1 Tax=Fervidicola ferrireducens TaxID=520764 RepID=A0A140L742_9FIRM|nr:hypothetical protein [Fervidicola ferrireducens]KXG76367.1 hypothetical protein AN618_16070 [Fervidicola ferrireducens]
MELEYNCPLCNGLITIREKCPECGGPMEDWGRVQDYVDPYQPYLDMNITASEKHDEGRCVHLFLCPRCGRDIRITVNQIPGP